MKSKNTIFSLIFPMVFGIIGFLALAGTVICYVYQQKFYETAKEVPAVITGFHSNEDSSTAVVTYQVDGQSYTTELDFYSSTMKKGDQLTVYYDPMNPINIHYKGGDIFLVVLLLIFGVVFGGIAIVFGVVQKRKRQKVLRLRQEGEVIQADITGISENPNMTSNGRHPFIIHCQYKAPDGKLYTFYSDSLWCGSHELPTEGKVPVYVDPRDYTQYHVDTDSL